jgi:hypothetical protein
VLDPVSLPTVCDSVTVELHSTTSPFALLYTTKNVLATNGTGSFLFPSATLGNSYYVVIHHRNSIETWSKLPITFSSSSVSLDLSVPDNSIPNNPTPTLTGINPSSAVAGSSSFTLTVSGSSFISGSIVKWNGTALTTTFVNASQLTAVVPATNISTAGTATVTVFNPTPGGGTSSGISFTITSAVPTAKKFLFDATKAETAGNADWVIDQDASVPRFPTPTQANITSTTSETYWTGALSSWGIALVKKGHTVESLPSSGSITYGNSSNAQDLSNYDVFVVDEPNIVFTAAEKTAIIQFVNNGGGLMMIADHTISDRNNDGWDSPDIWNDLMTNNSIQSNPFGFSIDLTNVTEVSGNILSTWTTNTILNGSEGAVTQLEFNNGATITTNTTANANVKGLIWQTGFTQNSTHAMCATSTYGTGRVFVVTDSSPMDDGTGNPADNLFPGWTSFSHSKLFMNASLWLAKIQ